jgi:hypothetical protein
MWYTVARCACRRDLPVATRSGETGCFAVLVAGALRAEGRSCRSFRAGLRLRTRPVTGVAAEEELDELVEVRDAARLRFLVVDARCTFCARRSLTLPFVERQLRPNPALRPILCCGRGGRIALGERERGRCVRRRHQCHVHARRRNARCDLAFCTAFLGTTPVTAAPISRASVGIWMYRFDARTQDEVACARVEPPSSATHQF